jgi:hypothetical protein
MPSLFIVPEVAFSVALQYASRMRELAEILVGIAVFIGLAWLYLKGLELYERRFGHPPEPLLMRWLRRRSRPTTILGKNDEDVL